MSKESRTKKGCKIWRMIWKKYLALPTKEMYNKIRVRARCVRKLVWLLFGLNFLPCFHSFFSFSRSILCSREIFDCKYQLTFIFRHVNTKYNLIFHFYFPRRLLHSLNNFDQINIFSKSIHGSPVRQDIPHKGYF